VRASFITPGSVLTNNILGTSNLFEAVRLAKIDPVIQLCSTSEVYGQVDPKDVPIKETAPIRPASPYAVSKTAQDLLGWTYFVSYKMRIIRTRMFAYLNPRRADLFATAFARQVARIERGLQKELVHGNLDSVRTLIDVRDAMRALPGKTTQERHNAARDLVYLLYLGLESGRKAIEDLVEFEPQQAERTIVVLLSELVAYCFLRCEFSDPNDMRCKRLEMRKRVYEQKISNLSTLVEDGHKGHKAAQWEPAWLLLPELHARYERAMDATKAIRPVQPVAV